MAQRRNAVASRVLHQAHTTAIPRVRHQTHYRPAVHMGFNLGAVKQ